jgi:Fe-S cluster assembly iron-binding protein IscA
MLVRQKSDRVVTMLNLTRDAASEIRRLANRSRQPGTVGLRITNDSAGSLKLSLAQVPAEGDSVVDDSGARVFLDQQAAGVLDDKTLDVTTGSDGRAHFAIAEQRE